MTTIHLKRAPGAAPEAQVETRAAVKAILHEIETGGEDAARACAARFDGYDGPLTLSRADIAAAARSLPETLKEDKH